MTHTSGQYYYKPKGKIDFALPEISATKKMTWNCHVDDPTKVRYDMILGRYILTEL